MKMLDTHSNIKIGNKELSPGQFMTIRVALETFYSDLKVNGLGGDEMGKKMTKAYMENIDRIREMIYDIS